MSSIDPVLWVLVGAIAVLLLLVCERVDSRSGVVASKLVASTCFLGLALSLGALATPTGRILFAGLLLCWAGDALLLPNGRSIWFRLGIGAFLLGHIAYAAAFIHSGIDLAVLAVAALAVGLCGAALWRWLRPHLSAGFETPVASYLIVIGAMVACAVAASARGGALTLAVGAIAFAVSDISVARNRFVAEDFVNSLWGLPTYYAAQTLLVSSLAGP